MFIYTKYIFINNDFLYIYLYYLTKINNLFKINFPNIYCFMIFTRVYLKFDKEIIISNLGNIYMEKKNQETKCV